MPVLVTWKGAVGVRRRLEALPIADVAVCSIVKAELFYGAMKALIRKGRLLDSKNFNQYVSIPFDDQAALIYGQICARLAILELLSDLMTSRLR